MNANDFITVFEYEDIKNKVENKEPFDFKKSIKVNNNKYDLGISGRWHTSWQPDCDDEVYSTFMDFDYRGSEIGIGGSGSSVDFESFEELREEINMRLKPFPEFEANEQLSFVL